MTHCAFMFGAKKKFTFPKTEHRVLFERCHETNRTFVIKKRRLPFDRLLAIRAAGVHKLPQMFQDRTGKGLRFLNVTLDAWIFFCHGIFIRADVGTARLRYKRAFVS